ncbi:MAG: PIN domain-containing protein [Promethearchaeota archaeon]
MNNPSLLEDKNSSFVILDSNFIFVPLQLKIDIFEEIPFLVEGNLIYIIPEEVIEELKIKEKRENNRKFTLLYNGSMRLLEKKIKQNPEKFTKISISKTKSKQNVDNLIVDFAASLKKKGIDVFIATNDKDLKRKARIKNIKIIFVRQSKKLEIL